MAFAPPGNWTSQRGRCGERTARGPRRRPWQGNGRRRHSQDGNGTRRCTRTTRPSPIGRQRAGPGRSTVEPGVAGASQQAETTCPSGQGFAGRGNLLVDRGPADNRRSTLRRRRGEAPPGTRNSSFAAPIGRPGSGACPLGYIVRHYPVAPGRVGRMPASAKLPAHGSSDRAAGSRPPGRAGRPLRRPPCSCATPGQVVDQFTIDVVGACAHGSRSSRRSSTFCRVHVEVTITFSPPGVATGRGRRRAVRASRAVGRGPAGLDGRRGEHRGRRLQRRPDRARPAGLAGPSPRQASAGDRQQRQHADDRATSPRLDEEEALDFWPSTTGGSPRSNRAPRRSSGSSPGPRSGSSRVTQAAAVHRHGRAEQRRSRSPPAAPDAAISSFRR